VCPTRVRRFSHTPFFVKSSAYPRVTAHPHTRLLSLTERLLVCVCGVTRGQALDFTKKGASPATRVYRVAAQNGSHSNQIASHHAAKSSLSERCHVFEVGKHTSLRVRQPWKHTSLRVRQPSAQYQNSDTRFLSALHFSCSDTRFLCGAGAGAARAKPRTRAHNGGRA